MPRQRVRVRRLPLTGAVRGALIVLGGAALIWYGAMTILLAAKLSPHTVNSISAYRTIYDYLAGIGAGDFTGTARGIVAGVGFVCFVVFAVLTWRALPRLYLARGSLALEDRGTRGVTVVAPRAVERAAELAALEHPFVADAAGRYEADTVNLAVMLRQAPAMPETLTAVRRQAREALERHGLPHGPINVTLAGLERSNQRELQ